MGCGAAGAGGPGRKRPGGCLRCKNPAGYAGQAVMVGHICGRSPGSGGMSARVDRASATLARDGYCVIERAADPALIAGINEGLAPCFAATPLCEGNFYGPRTKRFGALLRRSPAMAQLRSEEHTSELQSLMRISYAVFCLKKKIKKILL